MSLITPIVYDTHYLENSELFFSEWVDPEDHDAVKAEFEAEYEECDDIENYDEKSLFDIIDELDIPNGELMDTALPHRNIYRDKHAVWMRDGAVGIYLIFIQFRHMDMFEQRVKDTLIFFENGDIDKETAVADIMDGIQNGDH